MPRRLLTLAMCSGLLLWISNLAVQREARAASAVLQARHYPPLLTGRVIDLVRFTKLTEDSSAQVTPTTCQLVLFVDDTCAACRHAVPRWTNYFRTLPAVAAAQLTVVTIRTAVIAHQLIAEGSSHFEHTAVRLVTDNLAFPLSSGLSATPAALVLDRNQRLQHENDGLLASQVDMEELTAAIRRCDLNDRR